MKSRTLILLVSATIACFGLSYLFSKMSPVAKSPIPYPANVGNEYLLKRPKIAAQETKIDLVLQNADTLNISGVNADVTLVPSDQETVGVVLTGGPEQILKTDTSSNDVSVNIEEKKDDRPFKFTFFMGASAPSTLLKGFDP